MSVKIRYRGYTLIIWGNGKEVFIEEFNYHFSGIDAAKRFIRNSERSAQ